jgi:hypothetical protein
MKLIEIQFGMQIENDQQATEDTYGQATDIDDGKSLMPFDEPERCKQIPDKHTSDC